MPDLSFINEAINTIVGYFNDYVLAYLGGGLKVTGKFDYNVIVTAITELFGSLGSMFGG
jgi:uncharacterized YccA/Bax inhibitor family protein